MQKYKQKLFRIGLIIVLFLALIIRLIPALGNNFYFTMDQGYSAINVRTILTGKGLSLVGPVTSLAGIYAGPGWYWLSAIGYLVFAGHPFGGIFILVILNLLAITLIILVIKDKFSIKHALFTGLALQFIWSFYDTSRYSFNPFPAVFLTIWLILLILQFMEGYESAFVLAAIPVALSFHAEVATFVPLFIFYFLLTLYFGYKKKLNFKTLAYISGVFFISFVPFFVSEVGSGFSQTIQLKNYIISPPETFGGTQFGFIFNKFLRIASEGTIPQNIWLGSVLYIGLSIIFLLGKMKRLKLRPNVFADHFVELSFILFTISYFFYGSNKGWHAWQTVYLPPLIFLSCLFILFRLHKVLMVIGIAAIMVPQLILFNQRYVEYIKPSSDQSLLINEIKAIDWTYQKSQGTGFNVYIYLPSVLDTPYQYLYWWYGIKTYGYLPCEFASYPNSPKIFVPKAILYEKPKRACTNFRFLIIEPDKNTTLRENWLKALRLDTKLLEEGQIGNIIIEKREILSQ